MKNEVLTAEKSQKLLKGAVELPVFEVVKKVEQISIRPPLVLKIISAGAVHKTEIGGVKIARTSADVLSSWHELEAIAKKNKLKVDGIFVQEFVEGTQFIIGLKKDPVFGHVILFGAGGILTEAIGDAAIRRCPITLADANSMMEELRVSKLFHAFRNIVLNTSAIQSALVNVSKIPTKIKSLTELDINPLIVNEKNAFAVDVRAVLGFS
jgi:hypothetical protein